MAWLACSTLGSAIVIKKMNTCAIYDRGDKLTAQEYVKKHPELDAGRKLIFRCLHCENEQIGYSSLDGFVCEKCGGYIIPIGEIEPVRTTYAPDHINMMIRSGVGLPPIKG